MTLDQFERAMALRRKINETAVAVELAAISKNRFHLPEAVFERHKAETAAALTAKIDALEEEFLAL